MSVFSGYSSAWKSANTASEYMKLPDGEYTFRINKAHGTVSREGAPYIEWILTAELADGSTVPVRKTSSLSENALPMLKRDIKALGVDPDTVEMSCMDQWLLYFTGAAVVGRVINTAKGEKAYNNINFTSLAEPIDKPQPDQSQFVRDDDEALPF